MLLLGRGLVAKRVTGQLKFIVVLGQLTFGLVSNAPAFAQENDGAPVELDAIVLDGTKVDRDFLNTADSVGVVTGDVLVEQGVDDLRDVFSRLGNVRSFEGNRGENGFVIRGLNSEGVTPDSASNAPLTSVILDGATQSREATRRGARGLWDVRQVEVFRGPQSTLQGRGALAGAVIVETNDPTFFWEGAARGIFGEQDRRDLSFVISGPVIAEELAFRLSVEDREKTRDITFDLPANEIIGEDEFRNVRGKLLWEPSALPGFALGLTVSDTFDRPGVNAANGDDFFDRRFLTGTQSNVEVREADNLNVVVDGTYAFANGMELTTVLSVIDSETRIFTPDGSLFERDETRSGEDITLDARLSFGDAEIDALSGVVGLFYGDFTLPREGIATRPAGTNIFVLQDLSSDDETEHLAAYADLRYRLTPQLSLLGGGRLLHETVKDDFVGVTSELRAPDGSVLNAGTDISQRSEASFTEFLPKFGVIYELTDSANVFFNAQKGNRSGFSEVVGDSVNTVEPEFLWSYEIGYKAEDPDGRWRFGATAFYSRYDDQQITVPVTGSTLTETVNAGESRLYGAEIEGEYAFENGLALFGSVGLLKTEFTDFDTASGSLNGNEFPESPSLTATLGATYEANNGVFANAVASYTDDYFSTGSIRNDEALRVDSFTRVDAQLGYMFDNGARVALYVDNVFDSNYVTSLNNNNNFGLRPSEATVSDPRTVGVEVLARF